MNIAQLNRRRIITGYSRPTLISYTKNGQQTGDVILTKPANIVIGDTLIIICANDSIGATQEYSATYKPTGFTFSNWVGSGSSDCHPALFWRIADGTEGSTINTVSYTNSRDSFGFYLHIKGAHATIPIGGIGANYIGSGNSSRTLSGVSGNIDDLGIYMLAMDGSDTAPFSVTAGLGWVEEDEELSRPSAAGGTAGCFGTKIYDATAGTNVTIDSTLSDGVAGFQFRVVK